MTVNELTVADRECLLAYVKCGMKITKAARQLVFHANTVRYHLDQVKVKTGLNPYDFYDLVKLVQALEG